MTDTPVPPVHPGEILADDLDELEISQSQLARALGVPRSRINQIVLGRRSIEAEMQVAGERNPSSYVSWRWSPTGKDRTRTRASSITTIAPSSRSSATAGSWVSSRVD